jgi:uncharacterized protein with HEPN domain
MKNNRKESLVRLNHILKSIEEIQLFTKGVSEKKFVSDAILSSAVLQKFSVIGEAVNHVEFELLNKYDYPWHKVRSFRNMIAHEYFEIKIPAVWIIVVKDVPILKKTIQTMIQNEF